MQNIPKFESILKMFEFLTSPILIIFRIYKGKEDKKRLREKFSIPSKKRSKGKLIWFHGASVGELQSIVPLLEKLDKNKRIIEKPIKNYGNEIKWVDNLDYLGLICLGKDGLENDKLETIR